MADLQSDPEEISSYELTVLACLLEGGATKLVHTEDLAIRAFDLAPHRFGWRKYPDRIDLDIVRVSLSNATKDKNGALVQGSKDSGWSLTRRGMQWAEEARQKFPKLFEGEAILGQDRRSAHVQASDREAERLRSSDAYSKWLSGRKGDWTVYDFFKATRTSEYLPRAQMNLRHTQLAQLIVGDDQLTRFVDDLFNRFEGSYRDGME
jgi:hypothetical protein